MKILGLFFTKYTFILLIVAVPGNPALQAQNPVRFQRSYSDLGQFQGIEAHPSFDGGIWMTGRYTHSPTDSTSDYFLMNADSLGEKIWALSYGSSGSDTCQFGFPTQDGQFIMGGHSPIGSTGRSEIFFVKVSAGSVPTLWGTVQVDGGNLGAKAFVGAEGPGGDLYLVGAVENVGGAGDEVLVVKMDAGGSLIWSITFGGTEDDFARTIDVLPDNSLLIGGVTRSSSLVGDQDAFLVKINSSGNIVWGNVYEKVGDEILYGVEPARDKGYFLAGYRDSTASLNLHRDAMLIKTDSTGNFEWMNLYEVNSSGSTVQQDHFMDVFQDSSGGIMVYGTLVPANISPDPNQSQVFWGWLDSLGNAGSLQVVFRDTLASTYYPEYARQINRDGKGGYLALASPYFQAPGNSTTLFRMDQVGDAECNLDTVPLFSSPTFPVVTPMNLNLSNPSVVVSIGSSMITCPAGLEATTFCTTCQTQPAIQPFPDTICMGDTLFLVNQSGGLHQFEWRLDSSTIAFSRDAFWVADSIGSHLIELFGTTADSLCMDSLRDSVFVRELPVALMDTNLRHDRVQFYNLSQNADSVHWIFGDGTSTSVQDPLHWYQMGQANRYVYTFQAINSCGVSQITDSLDLSCEPPIANFDHFQQANRVRFLNFSESICAMSYLWRFGDGTTSTKENPIHNYGNAPLGSTFQVTLEVDNGGGVDTITKPITTGGSYNDNDWPYRTGLTVKERLVPYTWVNGWTGFPGDIDNNHIEDVLDTTSSTHLDILLALKVCDGDNGGLLSQFGDVRYRSKYIATLALDSVSASDLPVIAIDPNVAMIFDNRPQYVLATDTSTYLMGANNTLGGALSLQTLQAGYPTDSGTKVVVGLVDTGVNEGEIPGVWEYKVIPEYECDILTGDSFATDPNPAGHASQIAQVLCGGFDRGDFSPGMAPHIRLADIRAVDEYGMARRSDIMEGMEKIIGFGDVKVMLLALSIPGKTDGHDPVSELVNVAVAQDILPVIAAGNNGAQGMRAPAAGMDGMSIANASYGNALDLNDDFINSSSSVGSSTAFGPGVQKPDASALGTQIYVYDAPQPALQKVPQSGTSFAAAQAAGVAAIARDRESHLRPLDVKNLLLRTALPINSTTSGWDSLSGNGLLNAYNAIDQLVLSPSADLRFPHPTTTNIWDSPDIDVSEIDSIVSGVPITVKIAFDAGTDTLYNLTVRLRASRFGTYDERWVLKDTVLAMVLPGLDTIPITFNPLFSEEALCFKAELIYPFDRDFGDNIARKNYQRKHSTGRDDLEFSFMVTNPSCDTQETHIERLDTLPYCWVDNLTMDDFSMGPDDCPVEVIYRVGLDSSCCDSAANIPASGCCLTKLRTKIRVLGYSLTTDTTYDGVDVEVIRNEPSFPSTEITVDECRGMVECTPECEGSSDSIRCEMIGQVTLADSTTTGDTLTLSYPFTAAGAYVVRCTTWYEGQMQVDSDSLIIQPLAAGFIPFPSSQPNTINFFGFESGNYDSLSWFWDFDDNTTGTGQLVIHTYSTPSIYEVCLTVTNDCNSEVYCNNVEVTGNSQLPLPPPPSFRLAPNPASSHVDLSAENLPDGPVSVLLYNNYGQLLEQKKEYAEAQKSYGARFLLGNYPAGLYFVVLEYTDHRWVGKFLHY